MMLASVTGWRVAALILSSERIAIHPEYGAVEALARDRARLFGVDVFSAAYPSVSNHPVLWGSRRLGASAEAGRLSRAYDDQILKKAQSTLFLNPSLWLAIEASVDDPSKPQAMQYRYPLGTAQFLLAMLEIVQRSPRMFDREYLPWLIANCDGGLESIRRFPFNVPMWWSALAAAVGPSSISEQLYHLASRQRPNDFDSVTHRLRSENPDVAVLLSETWNLRSNDLTTAGPVSRWISDISGWVDPFLGGSESLEGWRVVEPEKGLLKLSGLPADGIEGVRRMLDSSSRAFHTSFSQFKEGLRLGWLGDAIIDQIDEPPSAPKV
jgi:hypothetical protein